MTSPQRPPFMLLGIVGQPSTRRYGLGSSVGLGYWVGWAWGCAAAVNMTIAAPVTRTNFARSVRDISPPSTCQLDLDLGGVEHGAIVIAGGPFHQRLEVPLQGRVEHLAAVRHNLDRLVEIELVGRQEQREGRHALGRGLDRITVSHQ